MARFQVEKLFSSAVLFISSRHNGMFCFVFLRRYGIVRKITMQFMDHPKEPCHADRPAHGQWITGIRRFDGLEWAGRCVGIRFFFDPHNRKDEGPATHDR